MSVYIKINGWFGSDQEDASGHFAKIFRMSRVDGESAMGQISQSQAWQFERSTSDSQSSEAQAFLISIGFDVELVPVSAMEGEAPDAATTDGMPQGFEEVAEFPGKPESKPKSKLKFSKAAMAIILLLILGAGGLTQTQFGRDLMNSVGLQTEAILGSPSSSPQKPDGTATPKNLADIQPLQTIVLEGKPSKRYPVTLSGCLENREQLNPILRRMDLKQTQSDSLCAGATIANPEGEWKCEFQADVQICHDRESYSCAMQYQCVPETADYNRARFKKELAALS